MSAARRAVHAALLTLALAASACTPSETDVMPRSARFGIFRDLILYERAPGAGGSFFLDRFETTRQDWYEFRSQGTEPWGEGPPRPGTEYLPVANVTLAEARAFARWKFCRLPRRDEWEYAATGRGAYQYPWGDPFRAAWVNSAELGLARATPVGTFESGRDDEGAYDLLGNVAEWTESLPPGWPGRDRRRALDPAGGSWIYPGVLDAARRLDGIAALRPWRLCGSPWPAFWWLRASDASERRLAVGGHFRALVRAPRPVAEELDGLGVLWARGPMERGDTVGIRLATVPEALLCALLADPHEPSHAEVAELRAFLRRPGTHRVLAAAYRNLSEPADSAGPLGAVLDRELRE